MYAIRSYYGNGQGGGGFFGSPNFGKRSDEVVEAYAKAFPQKKPVAIWSMLGSRNGQLEQAVKQTENGGVITSYSIHYTKLYDPAGCTAIQKDQ